MKHVKLFESYNDYTNDQEGSGASNINPLAWTEGIETPEGWMIDFYRTDKPEDLMQHYELSDAEDWSGLDYDQWKETINDMGPQKYAKDTVYYGKQYFRGRIFWEEMGISINYEIHRSQLAMRRDL